MNLVRFNQKNYDPFKEFFDADHPYAGLALAKDVWAPAIDISEDKENIFIKADLPGIKKEEVTVNIDNNVLTLRGERKSETETKEKDYHRVERVYGTFERSFDLGTQVDQSKVKAVYKDGVLEISLPKVPAPEVKKVVVE